LLLVTARQFTQVQSVLCKYDYVSVTVSACARRDDGAVRQQTVMRPSSVLDNSFIVRTSMIVTPPVTVWTSVTLTLRCAPAVDVRMDLFYILR